MTGARMGFWYRLVAVVCCLFSVTTVDALRCEFQPVERTYEQSSTVFLAKIIRSQLLQASGVADNLNNNRVRHYFEVVETFKGEVDYTSFDTGFAWPGSVAHFAVGDVNLFFMDEEPGFNDCSPRFLLGQPDTAAALQKMRDYKNGLIESLSGAWSVKSAADRCSIHTTFLVEESSSSLALSIAHIKPTVSEPEHSSLWLYAWSIRTGDVMDDSDFVVSYSDSELTIPYAGSSLANTSNYFSKVDGVEGLLNAILAEQSVVLEGVTGSKVPVQIPVLLNGGTAAINEFAMCSDMTLEANAAGE